MKHSFVLGISGVISEGILGKLFKRTCEGISETTHEGVFIWSMDGFRDKSLKGSQEYIQKETLQKCLKKYGEISKAVY